MTHYLKKHIALIIILILSFFTLTWFTQNTIKNKYFPINDLFIKYNLPIYYSWSSVKTKLNNNCQIPNEIKTNNYNISTISNYFTSLLQNYDSKISFNSNNEPIASTDNKNNKIDYGRYAFRNQQTNSECFFVWIGNSSTKMGTIVYMNKKNNITKIKVINAPEVLYSQNANSNL